MSFPALNLQLNVPGGIPAQTNPTHEEINRQLTLAVLAPQATALPSIDLLKYAAGIFNLYSDPNQPFKPSIAVRVKLLELAGATLGNAPRMLNFSQLSPQDLAAIFRIINSYSANYEVVARPYQAVFPTIIQNLSQYLIYLCNDERGALVFQTFNSYQDPSLAQITGKMGGALGARAIRQEPPSNPAASSSSSQRRQVQPPIVQPAIPSSSAASSSSSQRREVQSAIPGASVEGSLMIQAQASQDDLVGQLVEANDHLVEENEGLLRQVRQLQQENGALTQQLMFAHENGVFGGQDGDQVAFTEDQLAVARRTFENQLLMANQEKDYQASLASDRQKENGQLKKHYEIALEEKGRQLQAKDEEMEQLSGTRDRLARDLSQLQQRHEEALRRIEAKEQELARIPGLEKQIASLQSAPASGQSAQSTVSAKADDKHVVELRNGLIRELRDNVSQLTIKNGELDKQVKELSAQLRNQKAASQLASQESRKVKDENSELKRQNQELQELRQEVERLRAQLPEKK